MNETKLTEKRKLIEALYSDTTTNKIISQNIHGDSSDAEVVKQLHAN